MIFFFSFLSFHKSSSVCVAAILLDDVIQLLQGLVDLLGAGVMFVAGCVLDGRQQYSEQSPVFSAASTLV